MNMLHLTFIDNILCKTQVLCLADDTSSWNSCFIW